MSAYNYTKISGYICGILSYGILPVSLTTAELLGGFKMVIGDGKIRLKLVVICVVLSYESLPVPLIKPGSLSYVVSQHFSSVIPHASFLVKNKSYGSISTGEH